MKSIGYPKIFKTKTSSNIIVDKKATLNNIRLLLTSEKGQLLGDPYFGVRLKKYLFEPNNAVLKDIIIDEIYSQIKLFIPQVMIDRRDIDVVQRDKGKLVATIKLTYVVDFSRETYSLVIFQGE